MPDSFERHDKCQRPRISLQIKRCQPITPPIIRRKHREIPIFRPRSVCRALRLQNTRKNARRHHPHMARTKQKRGQKAAHHLYFRLIIACRIKTEPAGRRVSSLPAHSAGRKKPSPHEVRSGGSFMSEDALERKAALGPDISVRRTTRRCKPSCAYPQQHQTGCPSGSRGASSSQDQSRCSQPGRSRSRRRRRPCCRSRRPGR